MFLDDFIRVSDDMPCPCCGKPDWCCVSKKGDVVICQRIESSVQYGQSGYLHRLTNTIEIKHLPAQSKRKYKTTEEVAAKVSQFCYALSKWDRATLADELGVSENALLKLNVGNNMDAGCIAFPMQNEDFKFVGVRYRFPDGQKRSLKGGREGLFIPYDIRPSRHVSVMYIVEGPTDTAALLSMGLDAIGRPNCTGGVKEIAHLADKFPYTRFVVVSDGDKPGKDGALKLARVLPENTVVIAPAHHKDVREYYRAFRNKTNATRAILDVDSDYWEVLEKLKTVKV